MTPDSPPPWTGWRPRRTLDVVEQQLAAVAALHGRRHALQGAEDPFLQAQAAAVVRHEHRALATAGAAPLPHWAPRRAVLGQPTGEPGDRLQAALALRGVVVVASPDDAAELVGTALAEQPDVVLVPPGLPGAATADVVLALRRTCPGTAVAVQVPDGGAVPGAALVLRPDLPAEELALRLVALLAAAG